MNLLVTGGAGFIGSHFVRHLLTTRNDIRALTVLDSLTYAGNLRNLQDLKGYPHFKFVSGDICNPNLPKELFEDLDLLVNFAAESHVDRSITTSSSFIHTNIEGTHNLLLQAKKYVIGKFVQVSTDEVYGSIEEGSWDEQSPLLPNSPYAASKASADLIVRAFHQTFDMNTNITRCSNNFGTHQFPEKFIPVAIQAINRGLTIPIYGNGSNRRDWLSVLDHCRAIEIVMDRGESGQTYNVGGGVELSNLELAEKILTLMGQGKEKLSFVEDRKGHDNRYSVDFSKLKNTLGFTPEHNLDADLPGIIRWYSENKKWWD